MRSDDIAAIGAPAGEAPHTEVPFLAHAHHYFPAAAIDDGPLGELAGDLAG